MKRATENPKLYYRAREVAALTGLGLRTVWEHLYAGTIPSRKIGGSRLIPASWVHAETDEQAEDVTREHRRKYQYTFGNGPFAHEGPLRPLLLVFHCLFARGDINGRYGSARGPGTCYNQLARR